MNKKGLAQIPLMIGLLIMAVVVPIATRLVQQNQDTRNQATGCSQSGIGQCGANGGCSTGYRCIYGANTFHCSYDPACGGFTPTNTPIPGICNPGVTRCRDTNSVEICNSNGTAWSILKTCAYGCLSGDCKAAPPTATPTNDPRQPCGSWRSDMCSTGSCLGGEVCVNNHSIGGNCLCVAPTPTPTNPVCKTAGQLCNSSTQLCCSGSGLSCESAICCVTNGNTAPNKDYCCSRNMIQGKCAQGCQAKVVDLGLCRGAYAAGKFCAANERSETYMFADCSSVIRCVVDNVRCPTATPTTPPACNAIPGQYCAYNNKSCTDKGNSIVSGFCSGSGYVCCKPAPAPPSATPTPICNGQECVLRCATNGMRATCGIGGICVCVPLPTAIATPTKIPVDPTIPIIPTNPPPGNKCPGAEACPNSSNKNLLQNCTPADSDGTPKESSCTTVGRIEPCGGKNYCCPSTGGAWTTDMTKCPATTPLCTECPKTFSCYSRSSGNGFGVSVEHRWFAVGIPMQDFTKVADSECGQIVKPTFKGKSQGDANCDGTVDNWDYDLWYKEFFDGNKGATSKKTWNADFTGSSGVCDGKVGIYDYSLWLKYFNQFNIN